MPDIEAGYTWASGATVTPSKLNDSIGNATIAAGAVTSAKLGDGSVTAAKLAANSVTTAAILDANVTTAKLAAQAVTTTTIAALNVTAGKLADAAVTTAKIADANVTAAKLGAAAVTEPAVGAGLIIQTAMFTTVTPASTGSTIPVDSTKPQITEGAQVMTTTFTPKRSTSRIYVRVCMPLVSASSGSQVIGALFRNSDANAVAVGACRPSTGDQFGSIVMEWTELPASTATITYSVRIGAGSGTAYFLTSGAANFGGAPMGTIFIQELAV